MSSKHLQVRTRKVHVPKSFTIDDRYAHGAFTVEEAIALAKVSRATFSRHRKQGLVKAVKRNKRVFIPGPALRDYIGLSSSTAQ